MLTADPTPEDIAARVDAFAGQHVLVVGDVMLDEYVRGDVVRISPEAPVPVVNVTSRRSSPGGAANAAANIVSLGGRATLLGFIGDDDAGGALRKALHDCDVDSALLVVLDDRPTTHKLRVGARTQQIVRIDTESNERMSAAGLQTLVQRVRACADAATAFVVSDYGKGAVTDAVVAEVVALANARGAPVICDPKGRDYTKYRGVTVLKPNVLELEAATGTVTANDDDAVVQAGLRLLQQLGDTALLVTRGERGMTLLRRGEAPLHVPSIARALYDVTGAGDTVVGAVALALATRATWREALMLASHAAGLAVAKMGTACIRAAELVESLEQAGALMRFEQER